MSEVQSSVKKVIEILHDSHRGYTEMGAHLENPATKSFFAEESTKRVKFENELKRATGLPENEESGTAAGSVHRAWGEVKAHLGGGDHTLLETAELGEDAAKKAYEDALVDTEVSSSISEILIRQQTDIRTAHAKVKALRDSGK
jgi:uncharacterized protein (TIGR02284 family)